MQSDGTMIYETSTEKQPVVNVACGQTTAVESIGKDILLPINTCGLSECDVMSLDATCHIIEERCNKIANEIRELAPSNPHLHPRL